MLKKNKLILNLNSHIKETIQCNNKLFQDLEKIIKISSIIKKKIDEKNKIFVYGNGGSFSDAMHFSAELISTYKIKKRKPLPVINLSSNLSSLTAWSNDFNFNTYLARELEALSSKDDLLILYSTSGGNIKKKQSLNLINVAKFCKKKKIKIIAFLGNKGGELIKYADISYVVNSNNTPVIQETHHLINHLISEILDTNYS